MVLDMMTRMSLMILGWFSLGFYEWRIYIVHMMLIKSKQCFGLVSLYPLAVSRNQMGGCSWWLLQGNLSKSLKSSEFQG